MMNDKLAELIDELYLFDRDLAEVENKVTDHKKKRGEARKHIEELDKAPDQFQPGQIDNLLSNLEEITDRVGNTSQKLAKTDATITSKIKAFEDLLQTFDSKKEILGEVTELKSELQQDFKNVQEMIGSLIPELDAIEVTLTEMKLSTYPDDDFFEQKDEINDYLEDLGQIRISVGLIEEQYKQQLDQHCKI